MDKSILELQKIDIDKIDNLYVVGSLDDATIPDDEKTVRFNISEINDRIDKIDLGHQYYIYLTNTNASVAADENGVVLISIPSSQIKILENNNESEPADWTYTGLFQSCQGSIGATGLISVIALWDDQASVIVTATKGTVILRAEYTLTKVRRGSSIFTNIVDALDSTSSTSALSANQGRELNDLIKALEARISALESK